MAPSQNWGWCDMKSRSRSEASALFSREQGFNSSWNSCTSFVCLLRSYTSLQAHLILTAWMWTPERLLFLYLFLQTSQSCFTCPLSLLFPFLFDLIIIYIFSISLSNPHQKEANVTLICVCSAVTLKAVVLSACQGSLCSELIYSRGLRDKQVPASVVPGSCCVDQNHGGERLSGGKTALLFYTTVQLRPRPGFSHIQRPNTVIYLILAFKASGPAKV